VEKHEQGKDNSDRNWRQMMGNDRQINARKERKGRNTQVYYPILSAMDTIGVIRKLSNNFPADLEQYISLVCCYLKMISNNLMYITVS